MQILIIILFFICSYTDIRERKISIKVLLLFFGITVVWMMLSMSGMLQEQRQYPMAMRESFAGILPGAALLVCSKLFHAAIGEGDGYFLMLAGWMLGMRTVLFLLMGGLFLSAGYALFLLIFLKRKKTEVFPFIPFLFASYVLQIKIGLASIMEGIL